MGHRFHTVCRLARAVREDISAGAFTLAVVLAFFCIFLAVAEGQVQASLVSQPEGAIVVVDDVAIGRTPLPSVTIPQGTREIVFRLDGHVPVLCKLLGDEREIALGVELAQELVVPYGFEPGAIEDFLTSNDQAVGVVLEVADLLEIGHIERPWRAELLARATQAIFEGVEGLRARDRRRLELLGEDAPRLYGSLHLLGGAPVVRPYLREAGPESYVEIEVEGDGTSAFAYTGVSGDDSRTLAAAIQLARRTYDPGAVSLRGEDLVVLAIRGMLSGLTDRHTHFVPPAHESFADETSGHVCGVGVQLSTDEGGNVRVISTLADGPASAGGVLPGDALLAIDSRPTRPFELESAIMSLRGPVGTLVEVVLARGADVLSPIVLTRDIVPLRTTATAYFEGSSAAYLRLDSFPGEWVSTDLADDLKALLDHGARSLVLDLRGNAGGQLDQAVAIADMFIDEGVLVTTESPLPNVQAVRNATAAATLAPADLAMAVLIDEGPASAAEVLGGALRDHGRATIVGERSYGKGSVQIVLPLEQCAGSLALTVGRYLLPGGASVHGVGIAPDLEVLITADERRLVRGRSLYSKLDPRSGDPQLEAALEALRSR